MLPLKDIRERIEAAGIPGIKRVHGALQLGIAMERGQYAGDAYVMLQSRAAGPNTLISRTSQMVKARFSVLQQVRYANSETGEQHADEFELRSEAIIGVLLGWTPDNVNFSPFTYVLGRLLDTDGNAAIWVDEFETEYQIRSN